MSMAMRCLVFASTLVILGIVVLGNPNDTNVPQFDCGGDLSSIVTYCYAYVTKDVPRSPPSKPCCGTLKDIDVPCMCKRYFSMVERQISVGKAAYVARTCGLSIPAGLKCGSYTAPPPMSSPMREN